MFRKLFLLLANFLRRFHILRRFPKKISKKEIQLLPLKSYDGELIFVNTPELAQQSTTEICKETLIGFDTESKPAFNKGEKYLPSIVQIATSKKVYIFQLSKIDQLRYLKPIFENERVMKVGIAIRDDVLKLRDIESFHPANFKDISDLTKKLGIEQTGLRNLAAIFLKCRISKFSQVTDWSQEHLSARQLTYAATDAWISRLLYLAVVDEMK